MAQAKTKAAADCTRCTPEKRAKFLQALESGASVAKAAKAAGWSRRSAYNYRSSEEGFFKEWDDAVEAGTDLLEDEAQRRAVEGVKKPVYQGGKRVGYVQEYSDTLLIFMMKGRRPEKYRERATVEHTGEGGGPVQISSPALDQAAQELNQWRDGMLKMVEAKMVEAARDVAE